MTQNANVLPEPIDDQSGPCLHGHGPLIVGSAVDAVTVGEGLGTAKRGIPQAAPGGERRL